MVRTADTDLDLLGFSDEINGLIEDETVLSEGFSAAVTADFANDIRTQISSLTGSLLQGLIAVAIVSLLLIGWRVSVVTALFMATVMTASLAALWLIGYSLNTITLFGLILTLGLLVDDGERLASVRVDLDDPQPLVAAVDLGVDKALAVGPPVEPRPAEIDDVDRRLGVVARLGIEQAQLERRHAIAGQRVRSAVQDGAAATLGRRL